jgi:hypothetical protein
MSKTSTTKRALNSRNHNSNSRGANQTHPRQAAAAEAKTRRVSLRNASSGRLPLIGKKTRKKLSRQQAADSEVRDALNAEFRDLRTEVSGPPSIYAICHHIRSPLPPLCNHITFFPPILVSIVSYCALHRGSDMDFLFRSVHVPVLRRWTQYSKAAAAYNYLTAPPLPRHSHR